MVVRIEQNRILSSVVKITNFKITRLFTPKNVPEAKMKIAEMARGITAILLKFEEKLFGSFEEK